MCGVLNGVYGTWCGMSMVCVCGVCYGVYGVCGVVLVWCKVYGVCYGVYGAWCGLWCGMSMVCGVYVYGSLVLRGRGVSLNVCGVCGVLVCGV